MSGRLTSSCLLGITIGLLCVSTNFHSCVSATANDIGNVARRKAKLVTITIPDFDSYCYRDVKRKMAICNSLVYDKRGPVSEPGNGTL